MVWVVWYVLELIGQEIVLLVAVGAEIDVVAVGLVSGGCWRKWCRVGVWLFLLLGRLVHCDIELCVSDCISMLHVVMKR
jgi:hypothetical protein